MTCIFVCVEGNCCRAICHQLAAWTELRPTVKRELLLYSRGGSSSHFLSVLTSSLSLIVYLLMPLSFTYLVADNIFLAVCACFAGLCVWWWIVSWCRAVQGIQSAPFYGHAIPLWINRNIRWVWGHSWRGEVFSFCKTVLKWREPSGKRRSPRSFEQVPFVKNKMWKKSKISQGF